MTTRRTLLSSLTSMVAMGAIARGQFLEPDGGGSAAIGLGDVRVQKYRVGVAVTAEGGPCRGIYATLPVPHDWPEQKVRVINEETTPHVKSLRYRMLPGDIKQMVVEIPDLAAGQQAKAIVTFELERAAIHAPKDTADLRPPEKPDRALKTHLGPSPYIETRDPKIVRLAKETGADLEGWKKVEAIYDTVRDKVEYRNGELKGARRALADGWGDCEELTCLFIAMCRAEGVPARTVWVPGGGHPIIWRDAGSAADPAEGRRVPRPRPPRQATPLRIRVHQGLGRGRRRHAASLVDPRRGVGSPRS